MFKVKFLPARFGDAIWIEYGDKDAPSRVLIDSGTSGTSSDIRSALKAISADQKRFFELVVVSHIDRDHIEGMLKLLSQADPGFEIGDIWFNGWSHFPGNAEDEHFGAVQGERLTDRILHLHIPWNSAFNGKAIFVTDSGPLPQKTLPGGMRLTLLSPTLTGLTDLKPKWSQEVRQANLDPGFGLAANDGIHPGDEDEAFGAQELPEVETLARSAFEGDTSEANGSSIALLAEFEGKRVLLAADAHADVLMAALDRLSPGSRVPIDLFKISHHGSKYTTSRELIEKINCPLYVFSTNGSIFKHPDQETVSRVIVAGGGQPKLVFNYRSPRNEIWDLAFLKGKYGYQAAYPADQDKGIEIEV